MPFLYFKMEKLQQRCFFGIENLKTYFFRSMLKLAFYKGMSFTLRKVLLILIYLRVNVTSTKHIVFSSTSDELKTCSWSNRR